MLGPVFQVAVTKSYVVTRLNDAPPRSTGVSRELVPAPELPGWPGRRGPDRPPRRRWPGTRGRSPRPRPSSSPCGSTGGVNNPDRSTPGPGAAARQGRRVRPPRDHRALSRPAPARRWSWPATRSTPDSRSATRSPLTGGLPNVTIVGTYRVPADRGRLLVRPAPAGQRPAPHRRHLRRRRPLPAGPLVVDPPAFDAVPDGCLAGPRRPAPRRTPGLDRAELAQAARLRPRPWPATRSRSRTRRWSARRSATCRRCSPRPGPRSTPPALHRAGRPVAGAGRARPAAAPAHGGQRAPAARAGPGLAARRRRAPAVGARPRRAARPAPDRPPARRARRGRPGPRCSSRAWLVPGLPLPLPTAAWAARRPVFLAAVGVAVLAVGLVLRDTLASQLAGPQAAGHAASYGAARRARPLRPRRGHARHQAVRRHAGHARLTDMALPVVLAVVAGLLATRLIGCWPARASRRAAAARCPAS